MAALRETIVRALDWEEAHAGFDKAVTGIPADKRGARAEGFEHTLWQLVEHTRIVLEDLVDFAGNPRYAHALRWPDDYWPRNAAPTEQEWDESIAAYREAIRRLQGIARDESIDLASPVPSGKKTQTHLRNLLLAIDHNAYHAGQIVAVRRALGIWP